MTPLTTPGGGGRVLLVILRGGVPPGSPNPGLTKTGKVYTRFQTKTAQKPYPMGRHITYMAYIREYPPPQVTTSIFHFHKVISALPTPLTNPTPS